MIYKEIPYVKKKVSQMIFGTSTPAFLAGKNENELLDAVCLLGINTFDLARVYEDAEKTFGDWMESRQNREQLVLLSKCGHPSASWEKRVNEKEIRKDFQISSGYLHTGYIDIYLLHRDDPDKEAGETVEIFNAMHEEGKIGAFGASNWTHERIEQANEYAYKHDMIPFTVSSPNFSLAVQVQDPWGGGCVSISGPGQEQARTWYAKQNMPVIAYASLAHGLLSGKLKSSNTANAGQILDRFALKGYGCQENYERLRRCEVLAAQKNASVAQIAIAWIFSQNLNLFAVVSSENPVRMKQNTEALNIRLTAEEAEYLNLKRSSI